MLTVFFLNCLGNYYEKDKLYLYLVSLQAEREMNKLCRETLPDDKSL